MTTPVAIASDTGSGAGNESTAVINESKENQTSPTKEPSTIKDTSTHQAQDLPNTSPPPAGGTMSLSTSISKSTITSGETAIITVTIENNMNQSIGGGLLQFDNGLIPVSDERVDRTGITYLSRIGGKLNSGETRKLEFEYEFEPITSPGDSVIETTGHVNVSFEPMSIHKGVPSELTASSQDVRLTNSENRPKFSVDFPDEIPEGGDGAINYSITNRANYPVGEVTLTLDLADGLHEKHFTALGEQKRSAPPQDIEVPLNTSKIRIGETITGSIPIAAIGSSGSHHVSIEGTISTITSEYSVKSDTSITITEPDTEIINFSLPASLENGESASFDYQIQNPVIENPTDATLEYYVIGGEGTYLDSGEIGDTSIKSLSALRPDRGTSANGTAEITPDIIQKDLGEDASIEVRIRAVISGEDQQISDITTRTLEVNKNETDLENPATERFNTNDEPGIQAGEIISAIVAYNTDQPINGTQVDTTDVINLIVAHNT
ncbi:hypothetical protein [Halorientalis persicus]|uniref:hypothetical protein n=1 Tax=Halorientalis persicus TaxID=1367881 RepID=UPI00147FEC4D|nr:hypothetical protein [Halorientalis persicus]